MSTSPYPHKHPTATSHNIKGHRTLIQQKLLEKGGTALTDLETLEMLLYAGVPRGEIKLWQSGGSRYSKACPRHQGQRRLNCAR